MISEIRHRFFHNEGPRKLSWYSDELRAGLPGFNFRKR
jgi:hypothetical protein